jgi:mRNA interferase RelE/StbE
MSDGGQYRVIFASAAQRHLDRLPLPVAAAIYEHLTGPVAANPYRLGKRLDRPFDDLWVTRRGDYRILYRIDDQARAISVAAVAHRRDAYRPADTHPGGGLRRKGLAGTTCPGRTLTALRVHSSH